MGKPNFFSFLLFLFCFLIFSTNGVSAISCPLNFSYIETYPWNLSVCEDPYYLGCCNTLQSVLGLGLAQYLKQSGMFLLPDANYSSACLATLQAKLSKLSIQPSAVPLCFSDPDNFVANPSKCAGIVTIQDWIKKVGPKSILDTSCNGDLTNTSQCDSCVKAGFRVQDLLTSINGNATTCFSFTILYAAGISNKFGPMDERAANCIAGLLMDNAATHNQSDRFSRRRLLKLTFGLVGSIFGLLLAFGLLVMYRNWANRKKQKALDVEEFARNLKSSGQLENLGAKWFHISELELATNGFSQKNFIGQGANGIVHKGTFPDGTLVAVKQILDVDFRGNKDFFNEVEIVSKIRHRNLLSLQGCCIADSNLTGTNRFLVYDYMANGSLRDHLSSNHSRKQLTWPHRKNIILDVAKGIEYLHYGIKPAIYHRDIKASNILLDTGMRAKVADFGLAKQSNEDQSHISTTRVAGTHGYLAPEYALRGQLTEKTDVYSFGIVVLEIISGKKVLDTSQSSILLITDWAWMLVKSGNVEETFDETTRETGPKGMMERFVLVGIACAHVNAAFRPTIVEALRMLEGDVDVLELPDRPLPNCYDSFTSYGYGISTSES